jgi:hypothetical protein
MGLLVGWGDVRGVRIEPYIETVEEVVPPYSCWRGLWISA